MALAGGFRSARTAACQSGRAEVLLSVLGAASQLDRAEACQLDQAAVSRSVLAADWLSDREVVSLLVPAEGCPLARGAVFL